jgi:hypothetical protein
MACPDVRGPRSSPRDARSVPSVGGLFTTRSIPGAVPGALPMSRRCGTGVAALRRPEPCDPDIAGSEAGARAVPGHDGIVRGSSDQGVEMTEAGLSVRVARSIRGEPLLERELDALNMASRRPSPFNGSRFLQAFLDNDEFGGAEQEPRFLLAVEGDRLVGFLPLRLRRGVARALGRTEPRLEFFVFSDSDRPDMISRPSDERRVADAFWTHLLGPGQDWSVLELVNLEMGSPLLPVPGLPRLGVRARLLEGKSTAIMATPGPDLHAYWKSLKKNWRHTVGRLGRRLLASGSVELVSSRDERARLPLLDLYLDLERRSWKRNHGIGRHPARLGLHRALCDPDQHLRLSFEFILLDGVPIAGMIFGEFPGVLYGMEICYDAGYAPLGPGNAMMLLSVLEPLRCGAPSLNLFGGFAYYKANWASELIPSRTLQIFRAGSAHWAKAYAGDLRRWVERSWGRTREGRFNEAKREVEQRAEGQPAAAAPSGPPVRDEERALAARILGALHEQGVAVERMSGTSLETILPFSPSSDRKGK